MIENTTNNTQELSKKEKKAAYDRAHWEANKEKRTAQNKAYREHNKEKLQTYFQGYCQENKEKKAAYDKIYHESNKEKNKEKKAAYHKLWYEQNKQKKQAQRKTWYNANKQKVLTNHSVYFKSKLKEDYLFALKFKLRSAVYAAFYRIKQNKPANTLTLLGCTWEEAKAHFESLFVEGMSWSNHGEWHIDHIRPVSSFKEDELHLMNHISNLQPLWAKDNLAKGADVLPSSVCNSFNHS